MLSPPKEFEKLYEAIKDEWFHGTEVILCDKLTGGLSGAVVFIADIEHPPYTGGYVLKFDQRNKWEMPEEGEAERHHRAERWSAKFSARHIPELPRNKSLPDGRIALLYEIAGGRLDRVVSANQLDAGERAKMRLRSCEGAAFRGQ